MRCTRPRKSTSGCQPSFVVRLRRVADEQIDLGRTEEARILLHVLLPVVEAGLFERRLDELAHLVRLAGGDDVVVGLVLLQHQPHRLDVVAGVAPVALGLEVAEHEVFLQPELDASDGVGDLAADELDARDARPRG